MPETDKNISKWQKASVEITNLRFQLGKILDEKFSDKEKTSKKYDQLLETVDVLFDHVLGEYRKQLEEKKQEEILKERDEYKKKSRLISWRTLVITAIGTAVVQLIKVFGAWLLALV